MTTIHQVLPHLWVVFLDGVEPVFCSKSLHDALVWVAGELASPRIEIRDYATLAPKFANLRRSVGEQPKPGLGAHKTPEGYYRYYEEDSET